MADSEMVRRCPVCGSDRLIPGLELRDRDGAYRSGRHEVEVVAHPERRFSRGGIASPVRATVCGGCGYLLLFAGLPDELWRSYGEQQGKGRNDEGA